MFSTIKVKLMEVKNNVIPFNSNEKKNKTKDIVKICVGVDILNHFQHHWVTMHALSESNAKEAEKLAGVISTVSNKVNKDKNSITVIEEILDNNLKGSATTCLKQLHDLYNVCKQVEDGLNLLENLIEDIEFEKMKKLHKYHLDQYELRKKESLELLKDSLEEEHNKNIQAFEINRKKVLEERQHVFQEAFKNDIEVYKNFGAVPKLNMPNRQSSALLEEIQLEFDQNELDHFFNEPAA